MEEGEKMIEAVPFSEIWYKDCFYHALFSAIISFKKNYSIMQVNDFFEYRLSDKGILSYHQCEVLNVDVGLEKIGLKLSTYRLEENVVSFLKKWIDEGKLIILNVDRNIINSENTELDVTCHSILVYGYKDEDFLVMENRYVNSCLFEKKTVNQKNLNLAYHSFINKLKHFKYGMYVLENIPTVRVNCDIGKMMTDNIYKNLQRREKSMEYLSKFINYIEQQITTQENLNKCVDDIMKVFNDVIVNKTIEEFSIARILNDNGYTDIFRNILEKWKLCRTLVYKYQLLKRYTEADMKKVISTLQDILVEERKLILKIKEKRNGTED